MPSAVRGNAAGDPGLAAERTALSWQRMALSFMTLAAVTLGAAAHRGAPGLLIAAAALFAIAGGVWRHARRRLADLALMPTVRATIGLTVATCAAALIATVMVVVSPS
jgi:uncharacterized membrane protein YidH (DUF202 family)